MALEGFFIGFAQLALVLTGFVSVFVIFLADRSERSAALTHHAASMLIGGLVTMIGSLIPIVLYQYGLRGESLWWWAAVGLAIPGSAYFVAMLSMTFRLTWAEFREAGYVHWALPICSDSPPLALSAGASL